MKRVLSSLLVFVCVISLLPFYAQASEFPDWNPVDGVVNVVHESINHNPVYRYDSAVLGAGTIAFEIPKGHISIYYDTGTPTFGDQIDVVRHIANDKVYFVAELRENCKYLISFMSLFSDDPFPYTQPVRSFPWDGSLEKTVTAGQTQTVTVSSKQSVSFVATVPTSGLYTLSMGHKDFHANMSGYAVFGPSSEQPQPVSLGYWYDNDKCQYVYYMEAGVKYCAEIFYYEGGDLTAEFTLKKGDDSGNYGIWKDGETKTLTIEPHTNESPKFKFFVFKAEKDGKHCLFSESFYGYIRGTNGEQLEGQTFQDAYLRQGWVFELKKGQYYTIDVSNYSDATKTDTMTLQHYVDIQSGELKIIKFYDDQISVGLFTDPPCAAYEGITWSCSDPSVFELREFGASVELVVKKQGSAVITAKVGSLTKSITVSTTYTPPVMQEGKTEYIIRESRSEPCAYFTPAVSGKYSLSFDPDTVFDGCRYSVEILDSTGGWAFQNVGFEKWVDAEIELEAGEQYKLFITGSAAQMRFDLKSVTPPPTEPTQPQPETTQPTTAPTVPVDTQPQPEVTTPATAPTEPSQTQPQTEATQPTASPTSPSQVATEPTRGTEPGDAEDTAPVEPTEENNPQPDYTVGRPITVDDITQAMEHASDNVISFSTEDIENRTFKFSADAVQLAVDNSCVLSLEFPANVKIQVGEDILAKLNNIASGEDIIISVTPQSFGALNQAQQKAMDGWGLGWLLDMELTVGGESIHELGGKAQITFPNSDPSEAWTVLYLAEDGAAEVMDITCDENITFSTEHFSYYALVWKEKQDAAHDNAGSYGWIAIPVVLALLAGGGTAAFFVLKKKGLIPFKK